MVTTIGCAIMYLLASAHCGLNFWRMSDVIKAQLTVQGGNLEEWVRPYSTELTTLIFFFQFSAVANGSIERVHVDCARSSLLIINVGCLHPAKDVAHERPTDRPWGYDHTVASLVAVFSASHSPCNIFDNAARHYQ